MSNNKRFGAMAALLLVGALASCGGGGAPKLAPPPQGPFSNSSLSGNYAISATGANTVGFITLAGSIVADGNGNITSGVEDINAVSTLAPNVAVSGTYTVHPDGRGTMTLSSSAAVVDLDFVLSSSGHGLISRFDTNSTASGTIDLQTPAVFASSTIQGPFAFSVSGLEAGGFQLTMVGAFTGNGTGTVTTGVEDDMNSNGALSSTVAISGGAYSAPLANGRGVLSFASSSLGALNFAYYIVDANHLKLIETDNTAALSGDAFVQKGTLNASQISGPYAFTVGGTRGGQPYISGGVFTADGNGNITGGAEDVNTTGAINLNASLTAGTYSVAATGRGTLSVSSSIGTSNFVVYPSAGGLQMLNIDAGLASGAALAGTSTTIQGTYGVNFSAATGGGPEDSIGQLTADGNGNWTGTEDFNQAGTISLGYALSGGYSVAANGRGTATLKTSLQGTLNVVVYVVNSSEVLFIETDSNQPAAGVLLHQ